MAMDTDGGRLAQEREAWYKAELARLQAEMDALRIKLEYEESVNADYLQVCKQRDAAQLQVGELTEDLERARTYTGLEAQGCPLCTYVEGVFKASCSFHKKLSAADLKVEELQEIVDAAVRLVKWHGAGALKGEEYARLFTLAGTYFLKTQGQSKEQIPVISIRGGGMPLSVEDPVNRPFKMTLCDAQVGCFGQCGKLLPCEDHPEKNDANSCTCTPGGGGLCAYCRRQDLNMG